METPFQGRRGAGLRWLVLLAALQGTPAAAVAEDAGRLQELLYGEALFHLHQRDYLSAITRLQLLEEQGLAPHASDAGLLLARLKLRYGLHVEAGFDFHALLGDQVPEPVRNRAWYELARTYSHKGYYQAAAEVLAHVQGTLPADIAGDYQLLQATVLMALDRNRQAAATLEPWQGPSGLAAYAYYNRGIALVRAGEPGQAIPALTRAAQLPARDEEQLALRDKAHLSLGYAFARLGEYDQARRQLETVRPRGPFSNRALLALGWIAHKQGRTAAALVPWTELRGRSPADPAVLETLLVVPAVQRELEAPQAAIQDYDAAITAYARELRLLADARSAVRDGTAVSLLLHADGGAGQVSSAPAADAARYFGTLLASRDFQETLQGHADLQVMLQRLDQELRQLDQLAEEVTPARPGARGGADAAAVSGPGAAGGSASHRPAGADREPDPGAGKEGAHWQRQWLVRQEAGSSPAAEGIPPLPELELPAERDLAPLPDGEPRGLPEPDFSGLPPVPEFIAALPDEDNRLPRTEILWLPDPGEFRMPGEADDYAYPDRRARKRSRAGQRTAYPVQRLLSSPAEQAGFQPAAVPVGAALRELATALAGSSQRMAQLDAALDPVGENVGLEARLTALRARILPLRDRIANAIARHEAYTRTRALAELERRERLLEALLAQARLELAKTYDQRSRQ